jgi:hypothetical protein
VPAANTTYVTLPAGYRFDLTKCEQSGGQPKHEQHAGADYIVCHQTDTTVGTVGRYLVNEQGTPAYLVDPGINGVIKTTPEGHSVVKYNAPKATLMSYIIKGILNRELPWGLVLLGVFIAIVLELAGIPSLAFAVGVYLPVYISAPIFVGGMVRLGVDKYLRRKFGPKKLTEEQFVAETDKSPGVLLASGYIAGGALAGVAYAFLNLSESVTARLNGFEDWSKANNAFYLGPHAGLLALIPFGILTVLLYLVGREKILKPRSNGG